MNLYLHSAGKTALIESFKRELEQKLANVEAQTDLTNSQKDSRKEALREVYGAKISAERNSHFKLF